MERDVAAGAAAHEEAPGEVGVGGEPWICAGEGLEGLVPEPEEGVEGVVVGGREAVLRGEAVLDGEGDGGELGGEVGAGEVEEGGGGAEEDEAAAVEVEDDGVLVVVGILR